MQSFGKRAETSRLLDAIIGVALGVTLLCLDSSHSLRLDFLNGSSGVLFFFFFLSGAGRTKVFFGKSLLEQKVGLSLKLPGAGGPMCCMLAEW